MVWPTVNFADARAGIAFCTDVLGFRLVACYADGSDGAIVHHAELHWPEGGGFMCGTADRPDSEFSQRPTGLAGIYVVTDDPDAVHARCEAAGARIVRGLTEQDYGSREFAVADPEGNLWSFGTYRGTDPDAAAETGGDDQR